MYSCKEDIEEWIHFWTSFLHPALSSKSTIVWSTLKDVKLWILFIPCIKEAFISHLEIQPA